MGCTKPCEVCGAAVNHPVAYCCRRCQRILNRLDTRKKIKRNRESRLKALKAAWDGEGFRCYYTNVRLSETDQRSPLYLTFDHKEPRCEDEMVVTAAVINDMKTDMAEEEFRRVVLELAKRFSGGQFDVAVLQLKHWRR